MRYWSLFLLLCAAGDLQAQTAGGNTVYNFLRLPVSPLHTALGGENITVLSNDVTMGYQSPSLLRETMDGMLGLVFTAVPGNVKNLHLTADKYIIPWATNIAASVQYFSYGSLLQTDASGNTLGNFSPRDYVAQFSASRKYGQHWFYGAALKFIQSNYGAYRSSAVAADIGVNYNDSSGKWQAGLLLKNMGTQLRSYTGDGLDNLPFDLQAGITKRLAKAPIQFSLTIRELHRLILYNADSTGTFDHIMQHLVLATQFFITDKIEITAGYNHLRRRELGIINTANGLTGFSMGLGILLPKLQLRYARSFQTNSKAVNQFGLTVQLH
jgi:hypothetical protein